MPGFKSQKLDQYHAQNLNSVYDDRSKFASSRTYDPLNETENLDSNISSYKDKEK
jgi:hypothetical protein